MIVMMNENKRRQCAENIHVGNGVVLATRVPCATPDFVSCTNLIYEAQVLSFKVAAPILSGCWKSTYFPWNHCERCVLV